MTNSFTDLSQLGSDTNAPSTISATNNPEPPAATDSYLKPTYEVVFDGRKHGIVVEVMVPKEPYAKMMSINGVGDYVQFGRVAGKVDGKDRYFNTFLRGASKDVLKEVIGKKVIGLPVLMKKTMPDGQSFVSLDVFGTSSEKTLPTHVLVIRSKGLTDQWCMGNHNRTLGSRDHIFGLAAPLPGNVGFIKL